MLRAIVLQAFWVTYASWTRVKHCRMISRR
jgi:hypothetical protein